MKQNKPFKFGSIVDTPYFISREKEPNTIRTFIPLSADFLKIA